MPCARPRGPRAWGLADWQVPEYRTGVGSLDRLDRHVRVRRVRSGWRRRRYARAGHACAPAGWPPARRAASLTRDGSGGCRCRPDGILDRWLSVAAARRAWRLVGGSGGWAGGWWSRCLIYTGGSRSIRCRISGAGCVDGTGTRLRSTTYPLICANEKHKEEDGERTVADGFAIDRACMHECSRQPVLTCRVPRPDAE